MRNLEMADDRNEVEAPEQGMAHGILMYMVALVLSLPLFMIIYPFVPEVSIPVGDGVRVDHLVTFILVLLSLIVLVKRFQFAVYASLILLLMAITITGLSGGYGFGDRCRDYAAVLHGLRSTTVHVPMAARRSQTVKDAEAIRYAMQQGDEQVRTFAVRSATTHFSNAQAGPAEITMVQCFSIFKVINNAWRYVADPRDQEYFARAGESLALLAGDCDDHAVLMAACIIAVGGEARLVRTAEHIYPELKVGDAKAMERVAYMIRRQLFAREVGEAPLFYHIDPDGQCWINMDYTRPYPGGEVMDEDIIGILNI